MENRQTANEATYRLQHDAVLDYPRLRKLMLQGMLACIGLGLLAGIATLAWANQNGLVPALGRGVLLHLVLPVGLQLLLALAAFGLVSYCIRLKQHYWMSVGTGILASLMAAAALLLMQPNSLMGLAFALPVLGALLYADKRSLLVTTLVSLGLYLVCALLVLPQLAAGQSWVVVLTTALLISAVFVVARLALSGVGALVANVKAGGALARADGFTKLPNHTAFYEELDKYILNHQRTGEHFSLILWDIDNFKQINDSYGRDVGDGVILAFAEALKDEVGRGGRAFRYGGDKFAVLHDSGDDETRQLAQRIREGFSQRAGELPVEGTITLSGGICQYNPKHQNGSRDFVSAADQVLHKAKSQSGKNAILVWAPVKSTRTGYL